MSDALCGPSNPLQQFKQQTQFDRTLQQDRLTSRHTPAQGFRSHNPNAGLLDPEFEAFQAGVPTPDLPQFHHQPPAIAGPGHAPSWATDFQRMQISPRPPFQQQVPQPGVSTAGWAQGFQQHITQAAPRAQSSAQSPQQFQHMARYGMNGFQSNFAQPTTFSPTLQSKGKEAAVEQFDEAAFDRAFDQAREDMMAETDAMQTDDTSTAVQDGTFDQQRRQAMEAIRGHQRTLSQEMEAASFHMSHPEVIERLESHPIEEDPLALQEDERVEQTIQNDDDALAATARELLDKVEHNQTDKFKNSQFLGLMRKLRDREMKVEGDQMVETTSTAPAASTTTTNETQQKLNTTQTSSSIPFFDNTEQLPHPLGVAAPVDTRPPDYGVGIPAQYQDHDAGRHVYPGDGQEVVDYLESSQAEKLQPGDGRIVDPVTGTWRPFSPSAKVETVVEKPRTGASVMWASGLRTEEESLKQYTRASSSPSAGSKTGEPPRGEDGNPPVEPRPTTGWYQ